MRKWLITWTVLVFVALGVSPASAAKGQVTIALTGEPLTMDPHIQSEFIGTMIWPWACDNLIQSKGQEGGFKPWLAITPPAHDDRHRARSIGTHANRVANTGQE